LSRCMRQGGDFNPELFRWHRIFFHNPTVTSALDLNFQRADHRQGGSGINRNLGEASNSCLFKILTSNPYVLKILQSIFAEPAPVKAFRRGGGRGYPKRRTLSRNETHSRALKRYSFKIFFRDNFHRNRRSKILERIADDADSRRAARKKLGALHSC